MSTRSITRTSIARSSPSVSLSVRNHSEQSWISRPAESSRLSQRWNPGGAGFITRLDLESNRQRCELEFGDLCPDQTPTPFDGGRCIISDSIPITPRWRRMRPSASSRRERHHRCDPGSECLRRGPDTHAGRNGNTRRNGNTHTRSDSNTKRHTYT